MLAIDALTFRYPGSDITFRFDLKVQAGEIVGLTGPSGSGKSTLFDLVAGFLAPLSGSVALDGTSILHHPPERRPVSILFQSDNVFEHLSAGANVALALDHHRGDRDERVTDALERMQLAGLSRRKVSKLSGGQKQRVALARTLLRNRAILLLDEPFNGLDHATAEPIRQLIASLVRERGWHAILVSHQPEDMAALASRRNVIKDHRTVPGAP